MYQSGLWGSVCIAFGPLVVLILLWLVPIPPLLVVALGALFFSLLSTVIPSAVHAAASQSDSVAALYLFIGVLAEEGIRYVFCRLVCQADSVFREKNQVLFSSRFRNIAVGVAVGIGFGATQSLLQFGTLAEAYRVIAPNGDTGVTLFNVDACPQMSFLFAQSIAYLLFFISHICWAVMMMVGCSTYLYEIAPVAERVLQVGPTGGTAQAAEPIRSPSSLSTQMGRGLVLTAVVLHVLFSAVSLVTSSAFDWQLYAAKGTRGCMVSLAAQGSLTAVAVVVIAIITKVEVIPKKAQQA